MYKTILSITILSLLVLTSACSNSTGHEEHEHEEAAGFRLTMNGDTIVEQLPGLGLTEGLDEIELHPNDETALISIIFLADDGDEFLPEDEDYNLGYEFSTDGLVEFEQHAEDRRWSFHLHAEDSEGHVDLTLLLNHGDHHHFESDEIEIHVHAE